MHQTLLVAGIACVIAAIVGGGLKAFGIEIPVVKSGLRQATLGVLGIVLVAAAAVVGQGLESSSNDPSENEPRDPVAEEPRPDFPGGSERVYSANFATWPTSSSDHGSVSLGFGNKLVLQPLSNTWMGPGRVEVTGVDDDFVCDVRFRIEERSPSASLNLSLEGTGNDAERIDLYFSVWRDDHIIYTLEKSRVKSGENLPVPHVVTEVVIADREQLPSATNDHDWSTGSELTLKREGGQMQFFVNDRFVKEFDVSRFPVKGMGISAAHESKIIITSAEFRVP